MKKNSLNWQRFFDWKSLYYIAILVFIDFLASIPYLNYKQVIVFPHAGPGVFEILLLILSLMHKSKIIQALAYVFAFIKPVIAICIIKKMYKMCYFAICIYAIELLAAIYFIVTFRITETGVSLLFFVECAMVVFFLSIILLLIRTIRIKNKNKQEQLVDGSMIEPKKP